MPPEIALYEEGHVEQVRRLNSRLREAGVDAGFTLPEEVPSLQKSAPGDVFTKQQFVVLHQGVIRGGFILQRQQFSVDGQVLRVANCQMPVSEGIIDRRLGWLGVWMLKELSKREPLLYCLGMGGFDQPLPRLLAELGWKLHSIPFYFRAIQGQRFVNQVAALSERPALARLARLAPWGITMAHSILGLTGGIRKPPEPSLISEFPEAADEIWQGARRLVRFGAERDRAALNQVYACYPRCQRLWMPGGWAVALTTEMREDKHFGNLRVGTLVDMCAEPGRELKVASAATNWLRARGAELIVTNHSHYQWRTALRRCGYLTGPSNYILATSRELAARLASVPAGSFHITRGDGEGPTHL